MFIDASVIVAILAKEPGWEEMLKRIPGAMAAARFRACPA
nr:type II toxin-antitoxin system VapC family toxin [Mesorhizobium sp. ORS 3428]